MASVVTVATCSAKSLCCQNTPRRGDGFGHKSSNSAAGEVENSATSQSVIGEKNLVRSYEGRITPNNRPFPLDARKAMIGLWPGSDGGAADRASEDGGPASSQSAIGKKKLVRSVRGEAGRQGGC
jgi:hypothetical protein